MSDINGKLSSALSIVQTAKSKIAVSRANRTSAAKEFFDIPFVDIVPNESWADTINQAQIWGIAGATGAALTTMNTSTPALAAGPIGPALAALGVGLIGAGAGFAGSVDIVPEENDNPTVTRQVQRNPDGTNTTTMSRPATESAPATSLSITTDSRGDVVSRTETVSTPDTNAANGPVSNVSTTTLADGTKTTRSVTTPTGMTINEPATNTTSQPDDHKSTADERQEEADRNSSPGMDDTGWTDNDGLGVG